MRLVCPNCDAEYEVDASVIPDAGRDVQCSNCGHAWFQMSPQLEDELAAEEALFEAPPEIDDEPAPAMAADPPGRSLDESVLSVLREEADREAAARRAEAPVIETQSDLGLAAPRAAPKLAEAEPAPPLSPAQARIAKLKGIDPAPPKPQSRREMLPEIDEINSTLRSSGERRSGDAGAVAATMPTDGRQGAFRNGFALMLVLAAIVVVLYVMAPKLSQQIPGLAPMLDSYVGLVNKARMALDGLLQSAIGLIRGMTG